MVIISYFYHWKIQGLHGKIPFEPHFRPIPAVPNLKKKLSAIDFLKSLTDKKRKVKKNTKNANIVKYKNWMEAFPPTPTPPPPPSSTSPRIPPGRSQGGKVSLVSSQPQQSAGDDDDGDGGGVYVYLDPQRCFPRHLCRIPHDQFNQMITLENEIEIL